MTPAELAMLDPYFKEGEHLLNGTPIDWSTTSYETMRHLWTLRNQLGEPIRLIRGAHPTRLDAVDFCITTIPYKQLVMAVLRLPCSFGFYSGCSVHVDTRQGPLTRWLAVKESELTTWMGPLVTGRKDGWVYLSWNHPRAFDALAVICELSEGKTAPLTTAV